MGLGKRRYVPGRLEREIVVGKGLRSLHNHQDRVAQIADVEMIQVEQKAKSEDNYLFEVN